MRNYLNIPPTPASVWTKPLHFIAFGFGSGAIPFAPGTFGTLAAIPFYLLTQNFSQSAYAFLTFLLCVVSIWITDKASKDIAVHDHQGMCLDEIVGFFVTMLGVQHGFKWILAGFCLFRFFDIVKPWPISLADKKIDGGFGIIIDDVLAGIFSSVCLHMIARFVS